MDDDRGKSKPDDQPPTQLPRHKQPEGTKEVADRSKAPPDGEIIGEFGDEVGGPA